MSRYKHTTQHPNKLQRAIRGQDIGKIRGKLGEIIQTINIAILLLIVLVVITQCQPVEASNKIGNKPLFYATKQAIRGNYQKGCIPCQSRDRACNKHQFTHQNLCKMHQKTLESNHQK